MEADDILREITHYKKEMGCNCKKFSGSATTQVIRKTLMSKGFNISQRDVYIKGVPIEIDLLMLKEGVPNKLLCYNPSEVLVAFEIKYSGSYGQPTLKALQNMYDKVKEANNRITCLYLTIKERENYRYRVSKSNCSFNVFEMFLYAGNLKLEKEIDYLGLSKTGDWERLIKYLSKVKESNM